MKYLRPSILFVLFLAITALVALTYQVEVQKQALKQDQVELSKVKYGLFSIDEWKVIVAKIVGNKVEEFNLTEGNKDAMRERVSGLLTQAIDELEANYREENRGRGIRGLLNRSGATVFGIFDKMRRDIPEFTELVMEFLEDPANKEGIRKYVIQKINEYADETFAEIDYAEHDAILAKYGQSDRLQAIGFLKGEITALEQKQQPFLIVLFALIILLAGILLVSRNLQKIEFLAAALSSLSLLFAGIILPMIDIDARIANFSFSLLGESVAFTDQVLYFNSKSILQVVELMLMQGKADLAAVGMLVLSFSVLFPLSKLVSTVTVLYSDSAKENKVWRFFAFRTGKWSMADVMVIAIFMAYIGFNGIISEQLRQIENLSKTIDILSTNESRLQVGFFLFTAFTVLSLLLAHRLVSSPLSGAKRAGENH